MGILNTRLTTATTLGAGANIPVGSIIHKNSCNLSASGNVWNIEGAGYFKITANVTVEPTAVGEMAITMADNGITIAQSTATPAVAGDAVNLTLIAVVYNKCNCNEDNITLAVGAGGIVTEADVIIERM